MILSFWIILTQMNKDDSNVQSSNIKNIFIEKGVKIVKKQFSLLLCIVFLLGCIPIANASSFEAGSETMLTEYEVSHIKGKFDVSTHSGKYEYVCEVLNSIGVSQIYSDLLTDKMIDKLVSAEKIGYIRKDSVKRSSVDDYDAEIREYDKLRLTILWLKTGNEYTLLGGVEWTDMPILRYTDIISIDIGGGSIVNGSQECVLYYENNGVANEELYDSSDENYNGTGTACAFDVNIPLFLDSLSILVGYSIIKSNAENTICLQYFHKNWPFSASVSASYGIGISVSPIKYFTEYNLQIGTA